jgi:hypothetical protein
MPNPHEKSFGMTMKSTKTNRLASETSPYLLQHAHNPVDWYPWGNEAFEAARASNKPILFQLGMLPATGATSWPTKVSKTNRPQS